MPVTSTKTVSLISWSTRGLVTSAQKERRYSSSFRVLLAWTTTKKPINAEIPSEHEQKPNKQKRVNGLEENNMTPEGRVHNRFGGIGLFFEVILGMEAKNRSGMREF